MFNLRCHSNHSSLRSLRLPHPAHGAAAEYSGNATQEQRPNISGREQEDRVMGPMIYPQATPAPNQPQLLLFIQQPAQPGLVDDRTQAEAAQACSPAHDPRPADHAGGR